MWCETRRNLLPTSHRTPYERKTKISPDKAGHPIIVKSDVVEDIKLGPGMESLCQEIGFNLPEEIIKTESQEILSYE